MNKREAQFISDKAISALKEIRIKKNISQYKMAKDIGMSKSSILYIENLTQKPSLYTTILIADYLEVKLFEILKENNIWLKIKF